MQRNMDNTEIIIGTYESLILGYRFVKKIDDSYGLEASFTEDVQRGSLRCLCVSPKGVLVSSSSDDSVKLHNLIKRKDIGQLFQHTGVVNSIAFYKRSHVFTASEDGTICIWKSRNWEMIRTLKGHKAQVMAVAVHPSGKLGLSVGSDRSLLTWDLTTGKLAFQRKIKEAAQNILITSCGNHYILVYQKKIEICRLEDTKTIQEIATDWRINAACFVKDEVLAVAGDDRYILLIDILTGKHILMLDVAKPGENDFNSRVRCISVVSCDGQILVVAGTTNGNIKVFSVNLSEKQADVVLFYESRARITCMAVYNPLAASQDEEDAKQVKQSAFRKSKKRSLGDSEDNTAESENEQVDDAEDNDEGDDEYDDSSAHTGRGQPKLTQKSSKPGGDGLTIDKHKLNRAVIKKKKAQQKKKRKLLAAELEEIKTQGSKDQLNTTSSQTTVSKFSAGKSKKLKKKMKLSVK